MSIDEHHIRIARDLKKTLWTWMTRAQLEIRWKVAQYPENSKFVEDEILKAKRKKHPVHKKDDNW
eukprot:6931934-Karenia_brevis.AAC.1